MTPRTQPSILSEIERPPSCWGHFIGGGGDANFVPVPLTQSRLCNPALNLRVSKPSSDWIQAMRYWTTPTDVVPISVGICGFPCDMPKDKNGTHAARLCCDESRVMYEPVGGLLQHDGDTEVGTSGGPIVVDNNRAISMHRGWADFGSKGMANEGVSINHHGNNVDKFIEALAVMTRETRDGMLECDTFGYEDGDSV
ncbi:hypothetical protein DL766_006355 [Monosporascus sp. MC13-8B]|uniref:Peptidase S1 domain-containing protein n=1 Tax=Monosporascus cannonballus TaxID=155416 RepID=A0ABY0HK66_9PEZI|nr:hypothetical protein DL763_008304 [Monosporascus cannonballus]RYO95379.1 hypothetical protein DL762_000121 [Monosporascus cannonballus]RYP27518.1 hypothetical protein DL766_006355 [Monosporascus sp. MC13-8B]